ncbi:MAG: hypothetical protein ACSHWU_07110 [Marinicella sp.]
MLLRRITKHVSDQNWFAVFIDFLIVVVGVFIGIQVANWNADKKFKAEEEIKLSLLHSEFTAVRDELIEAKSNNDELLEATLKVLRVIRDNKEPEDQQAFLQVITDSGSHDPGPIEPSILTELITSGGVSELSSQSLRSALISYHEQAYTHQKLSELTLNRISTPHDGFHEVVHINPDFQTDGVFVDRYNWERIIDMREQQQVLLYAKVSLSNSMINLRELAETVLKEISKAQNESTN